MADRVSNLPMRSASRLRAAFAVLSVVFFVAMWAWGTPPAQAAIELLPSVNTKCDSGGTYEDESDLSLAGGGANPKSAIHIACADRKQRMIYMRYAPGRGITERTLLRGPTILTFEELTGNVVPTSMYVVASSGRTLYVAWLASDNSVQLAKRQGMGAWSQKRIKINEYPNQIALAANQYRAYLAWTDTRLDNPGGGAKPAWYPKLVHFASVTTDGRAVAKKVRPGPGSCTRSDAATFDPSIAVTKDGPLIAVTDTCAGEDHAKVVIRSVAGDRFRYLPSPGMPGGQVAFAPTLFSTSTGLYITYKGGVISNHGPPTSVYDGGDLRLSQLVDGDWRPPEEVENRVYRSDGHLVVAKGRIFVTRSVDKAPYDDRAIVERAEAGWLPTYLPRGQFPSDIVAAGPNLYFDAGYGKLGRAVVN